MEKDEVPPLSKETLSRSRVIAKGRRIRDVNRLVEDYGGRSSKWVKKSGPKFQIGDELFEYHWYENSEVGRFEIKRKRVD